MITLDSADLLALDRLSAACSDAIDRRDMKAWLATYSTRPEASYICNTRESVESGRDVAFVLDDCRARLEDRVTFVEKVWAGSFQKYQSRHIAQRITAHRTGEDTFATTSNFAVFFTPEETGLTTLFGTGVYEDVVVREAGSLRLLSRRAILDSTLISRYFVYPI